MRRRNVSSEGGCGGPQHEIEVPACQYRLQRADSEGESIAPSRGAVATGGVPCIFAGRRNDSWVYKSHVPDLPLLYVVVAYWLYPTCDNIYTALARCSSVRRRDTA